MIGPPISESLLNFAPVDRIVETQKVWISAKYSEKCPKQTRSFFVSDNKIEETIMRKENNQR